MVYRVTVSSERYTMTGNFRGDSYIEVARKAVKDWQKRVKKIADISSIEPPNIKAQLIAQLGFLPRRRRL